MKQPTYPRGKVLTCGVDNGVYAALFPVLTAAKDVKLVVDGVEYPVNTVAVYQYAAPDYRRNRA